MEQVAVNQFVKRQVEGSGKTFSRTLSFKEMAADAQEQMNDGNFSEGYRDGVRIVRSSKKYTNHFICPYVKIDDNTELISRVVKRQSGEISYIQTRAKSGNPLKAGCIEYILYRHDVLLENNEQSTNVDWELISINAVPEGLEKMPMGFTTMMRNQLELPGGTKAKYSSEEWAESVKFWQQFAALEN